jgi:hypothetical protein
VARPRREKATKESNCEREGYLRAPPVDFAVVRQLKYSQASEYEKPNATRVRDIEFSASSFRSDAMPCHARFLHQDLHPPMHPFCYFLALELRERRLEYLLLCRRTQYRSYLYNTNARLSVYVLAISAPRQSIT